MRPMIPLTLALACSLAACDSKPKDGDAKAQAADATDKKAKAQARADEVKAKAKADEVEALAEKAKAEKAEKAEALEAKAAEPKAEKFGGEFCATIIPCFEKNKFAGSFMADVTVDIEPDGSVSSVSIAGDSPKPVQACITDAIKGITLATYNGKAGSTRCTKSGQLMGGTRMIMSDMTYEVRGAKGEAAEGKAAEGKAAEAKAK